MATSAPYALARFNGGLFAEIAVVPLTADELRMLAEAGRLDWGSVEPAIFGTLFERSLDPSQAGAARRPLHRPPDIERVVEPVVMQPLRRRWEAVRAEAEALRATMGSRRGPGGQQSASARSRDGSVDVARGAFGESRGLSRGTGRRPHAGSGLRQRQFPLRGPGRLMDLEKEVVTYGAANGLPVMLAARRAGRNSHGLEINEYARELAQVVVWIGYLQWMTGNGFQVNRDPVLEPLETIRLQDALLDRSDPEHPKEAVWPDADFIIGNPPFLGDKKRELNLGGGYVEARSRRFRQPSARHVESGLLFL